MGAGGARAARREHFARAAWTRRSEFQNVFNTRATTLDGTLPTLRFSVRRLPLRRSPPTSSRGLLPRRNRGHRTRPMPSVWQSGLAAEPRVHFRMHKTHACWDHPTTTTVAEGCILGSLKCTRAGPPPRLPRVHFTVYFRVPKMPACWEPGTAPYGCRRRETDFGREPGPPPSSNFFLFGGEGVPRPRGQSGSGMIPAKSGSAPHR